MREMKESSFKMWRKEFRVEKQNTKKLVFQQDSNLKSESKQIRFF